MPFILTSKNLGKTNTAEIGGKGANIAELINAGFPVPPAFFVTTDAYNKFAEENGLKPKIAEIIAKIDFDDVDSLKKGADSIRSLILNSTMPISIQDTILDAYRNLTYSEDTGGSSFDFIKGGKDLPFVAVRSSGIAEDAKGASSAGQYETFLNVRGEKNLIASIMKCWASLFTPRVIYYRNKNKQSQDTSISVIIQRMINSDRSGVAFTVDPMNPVEGANHIVIEACWGLGETIVQGEVDPDHYVINKRDGRIESVKVNEKRIMRSRDLYSGLTVIKDVPKDKSRVQVLNENEIVALAAICKKIEDHYKYPQDIEWASEKGRLYIVQTRSVTTLESKKTKALTGTPILIGLGASPGIGVGTVKIVKDISELGKVGKGDILVTKMTNPDMVVAMEKAAGIVTDQGGSTCHAAIVSRELGIPCIVGTKSATQLLKDGQVITVDASHGRVFAGEVKLETEAGKPAELRKTKTLVKVNLAFPETAEKGVRADGVGLMRLEHMLTKHGYHPIEYIRQKKEDELIKIITDGVGTVAKAFYPNPVWVRSLDVRTDEYANMIGGDKEAKESNPMLGMHGIRRSLVDTDILKCEFTAIKRLYEQGLDNVGIMIPFTYDVSEFVKAKEFGKKFGLPDKIKFGVMVEVPSCALAIEEYCKAGIQFISFGSNDLTQLTLGMDRNNEKLNNLFDEMHPGMKFLFAYVIETCKKHGVETSICGEVPSNRKEAVEFFVNLGITSLSVNLDAIDKVRGWVNEFE
ncbi:MAG: phosphoenolpyruvate synthase [Candidatus Aenigmarchaeota archaeon]|nr:phosphoenolpyruvate synthase [Candidatus Aenigmarchaeota archaeon]